MDIYSVNEATASGAIMFLFVIDEATRYKWVFLLEKKSETTHYIIKLLNELHTQFKKYQVQQRTMSFVSSTRRKALSYGLRMLTRHKRTGLQSVRMAW
ncbi:hypothetical protein PF008_g15555 [Phytophthora fragariae]|uniref:Integrase catalytic domain-containing protein n=1 Tax=Phytophthora fragariae TaxID=53985 RepID=A0A6G0RDX8_9STRA|nr:hypothetical protein PF008_g15555 [Phytophthora fragariae]